MLMVITGEGHPANENNVQQMNNTLFIEKGIIFSATKVKYSIMVLKSEDRYT